MNTEQVLKLIEVERERQLKKWGDQKHPHGKWLLILQEELGEVSKAVLEDPGYTNNPHLLEEMVQSAAVITAWIEDYTRWTNKPTEIEKKQTDSRKSAFSDYGLTEAQFLLLRDIFEESNHPRPRRSISGDYDVLLKYDLIKPHMLKSGRDPEYGYVTTETGKVLMFKERDMRIKIIRNQRHLTPSARERGRDEVSEGGIMVEKSVTIKGGSYRVVLTRSTRYEIHVLNGLLLLFSVTGSRPIVFRSLKLFLSDTYIHA